MLFREHRHFCARLERRKKTFGAEIAPIVRRRAGSVPTAISDKNAKESDFSAMKGKKANTPGEQTFVKACDQNIYEALLLADRMIDLADRGDQEREDAGCGILYGILRDSAYKIKKVAEKERQSHIRKGMWKGLPTGGVRRRI
jgi:hypothetical protein